jgi:hypothetical protein
MKYPNYIFRAKFSHVVTRRLFLSTERGKVIATEKNIPIEASEKNNPEKPLKKSL